MAVDKKGLPLNFGDRVTNSDVKVGPVSYAQLTHEI